MKVAFVGGTRFIGRAAAARAIERGHDVSVLHRGRHPSDLAEARPILVDRADPSALSETIVRLAPEVVIDTLAATQPEAEATVLAAKIAGVPIVALSCRDVAARLGAPEAASAPPAEPVFQAACSDVASVTILRVCAVYGERDPRRRFGFVVDRIDAGERTLPCARAASLRMCHAHARDVAHAIVLAAERRQPGLRVFEIGEATTPTMRERCETFAAAMDACIDWIETTDPLPAELALLGVFDSDFLVDSSAIRSVLGFAEVTTETERIEDQIAWLRASRVAGQ